LNLLKGVVLHDLSDELSVDLDVLVGGSTSGDLVEEFSEIDSDGKIDQHALVETGVVVTIDGLNILQLGEAAERVCGAHELLDATLGLESFNDEDNVLNLILVEHHLQELVERVNGLTHHVLDLVHQSLLHSFSENLHLELGAVLRSKDIAAVVGVLEDEFELRDVSRLLQLLVLVVAEETLAETATKAFNVAIVHVAISHFSA